MTARHDAGSSPLARGLRRREEERRGRGRIIPARAGFTLEPDLGAEPAVDHPRSRGVYCATPWPRVPRPGSSPLARGLQREEYEYGAVGRIIPARAGFTTRWPTPAMSTSDHPRSRGVYAAALPGKWIDGGSSPLARGLLNADTTTPPEPGIIPARAGFTTSSAVWPRRTADHPRSRGVYGLRDDLRAAAAGSSPLARGLQDPHSDRRVHRRIIPARAGFTGVRGLQHGIPADHPRSRGVYVWSGAPISPIVGSSPLARGLLNIPGAYEPAVRIIPARAGFTRARRHRPARARDHPRSRGVYQSPKSQSAGTYGSSPLARGLLLRHGGQPGRAGIIPARAGFTRRRRGAPRRCWDHPRSRGVYLAVDEDEVTQWGSSPLARGLRPVRGLRVGRRGIIPARAGFTHRRARVGRAHQDHPRSRGVYSAASRAARSAAGSSPLARGLPHPHAARGRRAGIIPARAGFTPAPCAGAPPPPDHPRSRGVYAACDTKKEGPLGSSPLARGLRVADQPDRVPVGIIPARAGFTGFRR